MMDWIEGEDPRLGTEQIEEAAKEPTLDTHLNRDPAGNTAENRRDLVALFRRDRAAFIKAGKKET